LNRKPETRPTDREQEWLGERSLELCTEDDGVGTTRHDEITWFRSGERDQLITHFTTYLEITASELERLVMAVVERNLQAQRAVMEQWADRYNGELLLE
jgi:hypothetical protein